MRRFFLALHEAGEGGCAARTLHTAQQQMRGVFPGPFHWGGWLLYGAP